MLLSFRASFTLNQTLNLSRRNFEISRERKSVKNPAAEGSHIRMSESDDRREQRSELRNGGNVDEKEEEEQDDDEDDDKGARGERKASGKGVSGISRVWRNAVKRRPKKRRKQNERRGRRSGNGGGGGCYVCFMQPRTEESPDTPTSDPKTLIERNVFYSKECNPHI